MYLANIFCLLIGFCLKEYVVILSAKTVTLIVLALFLARSLGIVINTSGSDFNWVELTSLFVMVILKWPLLVPDASLAVILTTGLTRSLSGCGPGVVVVSTISKLGLFDFFSAGFSANTVTLIVFGTTMPLTVGISSFGIVIKISGSLFTWGAPKALLVMVMLKWAVVLPLSSIAVILTKGWTIFEVLGNVGTGVGTRVGMGGICSKGGGLSCSVENG